VCGVVCVFLCMWGCVLVCVFECAWCVGVCLYVWVCVWVCVFVKGMLIRKFSRLGVYEEDITLIYIYVTSTLTQRMLQFRNHNYESKEKGTNNISTSIEASLDFLHSFQISLMRSWNVRRSFPLEPFQFTVLQTYMNILSFPRTIVTVTKPYITTNYPFLS